MSRIGKEPIKIPSGVNITIDGNKVTVTGPKGELVHSVSDRVNLKIENDELNVTRIDNEKYSRADHGLYRTIIANMIEGVTNGFKKVLEVEGVGFKVSMNGKGLKMALGFSHDVIYDPKDGVELSVEENRITVSGIDKQKVGQAAAEIRQLKKPEPYKGKGIRYQGEHIIRKAGKAAGGGGD